MILKMSFAKCIARSNNSSARAELLPHILLQHFDTTLSVYAVIFEFMTDRFFLIHAISIRTRAV